MQVTNRLLGGERFFVKVDLDVPVGELPSTRRHQCGQLADERGFVFKRPQVHP